MQSIPHSSPPMVLIIRVFKTIVKGQSNLNIFVAKEKRLTIGDRKRVFFQTWKTILLIQLRLVETYYLLLLLLYNYII